MITFQNYKLLVSIDNSLGSKGFSELISLCMKKGHKNCSRDKGKRTECDFETFTLSLRSSVYQYIDSHCQSSPS